ncbi:MAG: recombinase family protein [Calothrix sp. C42_A2020_038]|nr:recombinase family protein [Calothrix sp. C42_A2020_038]
MVLDLLWVTGGSRSGKTTRLVEQFCFWVQATNRNHELFYTKKTRKKSNSDTPKRLFIHPQEPGILVFAANNDLQRELADKIIAATQGKYPIRVKTPLSFFQQEVILFFPLLVELLGLKAQFPVRLRPETEQELARRLWHPRLDEEILRRAGVNEYRFVRRVIDLMQLAALSGNKCEDITGILAQGLGSSNGLNLEPELYSELIIEWRDWCLERGFLTYGVITDLYCQHLLPNASYQQRLRERYQAILADDIGDYPAVARDLFDVLIDKGAVGAFSYNPDSVVRLGLGADPVYLESLAERCQVEILSPLGLAMGDTLASPMLELVSEPMTLLNLPDSVQAIQTTSRAALLRQTAETIVKAVKLRQVEPKDIAIIGPGLDPIAEYTLTEILTKQNIYVNLLNNQRPLIASPLIRALLTLISLVYPGNGRLIDRDAVAEMLVVLSRGNLVSRGDDNEGDENLEDDQLPVNSYPHIDPVRAGLIADYCFVPHPDTPNLLPATSFDRWDRLGYAATKAYEEILQWIETQRKRQQERVIPSPISLFYTAIEKFFLNVTNLPYDQITTLRELLETAQHYWEIDTRLKSQRVGEGVKGKGEQLSLTFPNSQFSIPNPFSTNSTIAEFIQLLRRGTIVSYPYPVRPVGPAANAVTISTIFQYRSSHKSHNWHFWLDAGSHLWAKGGAATLYGANLFLRDRLGQPWTAEDETLAENQRIKRILADLLARVSERLYLCHSELAVNGQEQLGPLLPIVNASLPVVNETQ